MTAAKKTAKAASADYVVKDIGLAEWGRKEIAIAETEMPGLMATREEFGPEQPLRGARIAGSLHMTIQTAVLIETLEALGADVRWASCNIYSTQDHAAAAIAAGGTPVFAVKGESLEEYWDYTHRIFEWDDGGTPNMILDDGGDATLLVHLGMQAEKNASVLDASDQRRGGGAVRGDQEARSRSKPGWYAALAQGHQGRHRGDHDRRAPALPDGEGRPAAVPRRSTSTTRVTKSKFDNLYGCRESLVDGIRRGTDVMMAGKVAMVAGYGDVGKGSAAVAAAGRLPRAGHRDRPDLRAAGGDGGLRGHHHGGRRAARRHLRHRDRQRRRHHRSSTCGAMKHRAIVCNIGHFDSEIQVAALKNLKWHNVKPQVDEIEFPDGKRIILLSEGRLVNLGNAIGHPSFVMSSSFTNQTLAQIELWTKPGQVREAGLHAAQAARREGRAAAPRQDRRQADRAQREAVDLHRRAGRRARTSPTTIGIDAPAASALRHQRTARTLRVRAVPLSGRGCDAPSGRLERADLA